MVEVARVASSIAAPATEARRLVTSFSDRSRVRELITTRHSNTTQRSRSGRCPRDASKHAAEHEVMYRAEDVPIEDADISGWVELGGLTDMRPASVVGSDLELQPQPPGDLHLGGESQELIRLDAFDAPEVDGVSDPQVQLVAPAPPQSHPSSQRV